MTMPPAAATRRPPLLAGVPLNNESSRAIQACNDFLRLGPGRSLAALAAGYRETPNKSTATRSEHTLYKWSAAYGWGERAAAYDLEVTEAAKNARRASVLEAGLALDYERVAKLQTLAAFLEAQIYEQGAGGVYHNVWVPDVKAIGSGPWAERVDLERFNGDLLAQYRGVLDDLAQETGGRVSRQEITGADGAPLVKVYLGVDLDRV